MLRGACSARPKSAKGDGDWASCPCSQACILLALSEAGRPSRLGACAEQPSLRPGLGSVHSTGPARAALALIFEISQKNTRVSGPQSQPRRFAGPAAPRSIFPDPLRSGGWPGRDEAGRHGAGFPASRPSPLRAAFCGTKAWRPPAAHTAVLLKPRGSSLLITPSGASEARKGAKQNLFSKQEEGRGGLSRQIPTLSPGEH